RLLSTLNQVEGGLFLRLQFSSDNKYIAGLGHDQELVIWDVASGKENIDRIEKSEEIQGTYYPRVSFSPDSQFIAVSTGDRSVRLFHLREIKEGEREAKEVLRIVPGGNITDFSYSPDGKSVVTADVNGQTAVWSLMSPFESEKMSEIST